MNREVILELKNLHIEIEQKKTLKELNLQLERGKIYALMGPNGAGKSTLAYAIMGHPKFKVSRGEIIFKGEDITNLSPSARAQRGIILAFQYPLEISRVTPFNFLRLTSNTIDNEKILPNKRISNYIKPDSLFMMAEENLGNFLLKLNVHYLFGKSY